MKQDWFDFLQKQGAVDKAQNFGNPREELLRAQSGTVLVPLENLALIRASGEEAKQFLHNLLTNDIKGLRADAVQYNGFCNPKGRLMASFMVWHAGQDLMLALSADLHAAMLKKLSMYILRTKVKLTDASSEFVLLGLSGEKAQEALREIAPVPPAAMKLLDFDDGQLLRLEDQRFVAVVSTAAVMGIWSKLTAIAGPAGLASWQWLEISAGIPVVTAATTEEFIPQMVNFDLVGGVSFKKGCYPGQEIVARTQYLGKLKRRMYRAHLDAAPISPGDHIYAPETGEQSCGRVLNVAPSPQGGHDLLAVIQSSCADTGELHLGNPAGPDLHLQSLPYALPSDDIKS